ncbi:hypothetical protein F4821DRAFT_277257 [Hypoxylon rubiginosum]|uniref:Uncharacterized protein n=1 Tax=Hypoxylon rubiginosum TaxID=110542 RepID=A0ACC0D6M1_9PEZI|nr:hypothetical protein F4821DRAFT_277257 [Hypoxylon rubiginosum]
MTSAMAIREGVRGLETLARDAAEALNTEMDQFETALGMAMEALVDDEISDKATMSIYNRGALSRPHVAWLVINQAWKIMVGNDDAVFTAMIFLPPDEGPICPDPEEVLRSLCGINFFNTTHPCGLVGEFAYWIFTGRLWADSRAEENALNQTPRRYETAPTPVSAWSTNFEDAFEEWNEAKAHYEDGRSIEDFLILWSKAEHALTLAGRHNLLDTPELLPRLLGWLGYALRPAAGHTNGVPHYQSSDSMDTSASDSDRSRDNPFDGTERDSQAHEIVARTVGLSEDVMWYALQSQSINLVGSVEEDAL